jgi:hypothetical protein
MRNARHIEMQIIGDGKEVSHLRIYRKIKTCQGNNFNVSLALCGELRGIIERQAIELAGREEALNHLN